MDRSEYHDILNDAEADYVIIRRDGDIGSGLIFSRRDRVAIVIEDDDDAVALIRALIQAGRPVLPDIPAE